MKSSPPKIHSRNPPYGWAGKQTRTGEGLVGSSAPHVENMTFNSKGKTTQTTGRLPAGEEARPKSATVVALGDWPSPSESPSLPQCHGEGEPAAAWALLGVAFLT